MLEWIGLVGGGVLLYLVAFIELRYPHRTSRYSIVLGAFALLACVAIGYSGLRILIEYSPL